MRNLRSIFVLIFVLASSFLFARQGVPRTRPAGMDFWNILFIFAIVVIIIILVLLKKVKKIQIEPQERKEIVRKQSKNGGIILCVVGV